MNKEPTTGERQKLIATAAAAYTAPPPQSQTVLMPIRESLATLRRKGASYHHQTMKPFFLVIPVVMLLASCTSKPTQRIVPVTLEISGRTLKRGETASVRHPEVVKAYPVGRYVEPRKRGVMHEAHTIY